MRGPIFRLLWTAALALGLTPLAMGACGSSSVPSPFHGSDAGDAAEGEAADGAEDVDPRLGPPCLDDLQCNDGLDCTFDACDHTIGRCRFTPDDSKCQDDVYCDGLEVCDVKLGCQEGIAVACDDANTCTIDTCIEATKTCKTEPRDADGDGDPDWSCGGGDCNDTDPTVSSKTLEVCANGKDDDCDGTADETECSTPKNDTCGDALEITAAGTYVMSLAAATGDYGASCSGGGTTVDVVAAIQVPSSGPMDVDVVALSDTASIALAGFGQCGDASSEIACDGGHSYKKGGQISRIRLRSLSPGFHPVLVFGVGSGNVTLKVQFLPPSQAPTNETCGTAATLAPGVKTTVSIVDAQEDVTSDCGNSLGELVYRFDLSTPQDVDVWATSVDGYGTPLLSLLDAPCITSASELACNSASQAHVFGRALPPGSHFVAVSASAPTDVDLTLELSPPTPSPLDETCSSGAVISPNTTQSVPLAGHTDDLKLGCISGAVDAAYTLDLSVASDVLLVARSSNNDTVGVSLVEPPCSSSGDVVVCGTSSVSPVRAGAHKVAAGSHRVVIESKNSTPTTLTAFTRPATAPTLVAFADTCQTAVKVPPTGGFFQGNTANATADYAASCDLGGGPPGGAKEQMLRLDLPAKKRVVLDMLGSSYNTLLAVRDASSCPGTEEAKACAAGYNVDRSFLDLTLDAGSYFIQIDGYAGGAGQWFLEVFVAEP